MRHTIDEYKKYVKEEIEIAIQKGFEYLHEDFPSISGDISPLSQANIEAHTRTLCTACAKVFQEQILTNVDTNICKRWVQGGNDITFVIKTEGQEGYWIWSITTGVWEKYFEGQKEVSFDNIQDFINHPDNTDKGTASGSYETVKEALADIESI